MTVKAIFSECSLPFWIDTAANLVSENNWKPCYWIASPDFERPVRDRFPGVIFHSSLDAIRGIPPRDCPNIRLAVLDQQFLEDLSFHESTVLKMMDRMDPGDSYTYQERIRSYHFQLMYWLAIIDRYKPDIAVFPQSPHVVYDYILYVICQKRDVKTLMFERIAIPGQIFPLEKFENGSNALISIYRDELSKCRCHPVKLLPITEDHLKRVSGQYSSAIPFYVEEKLQAITNHSAFRDRMFKYIFSLHKYPLYCYRLIMKMYRFITTPAPPNYLKQKGKNIEDSHMKGVQWRFYKIKARRKKSNMRTYYKKLTKDVDLSKPYIYVPLSYQPERTTSPGGGSFVNLFLMIDLLSKTVPNGWQIYVKEHPLQLSPIMHGERSRTIWFYDDLASLPNVNLVPISMSTFMLIDNAMAVATVTGNVGWEAVIRGKPVLVFGYAWYRGCEGVFYTPTRQCCKEALSEIEAGYKVDKEKMRLFNYALEQVCFRGYVDANQGRVSGISHEENVQSITQALRDLVN